MKNYPNILFSSLVGSKAYNLATESSDIDLVFIYAKPTQEIWGLNWEDQTPNHQVISEGCDRTYFEIGSFLKMMFKGNFKTLESIHSPSIKYGDFGSKYIDWLQDDDLISQEKIITSIVGFMVLKYKEIEKDGYLWNRKSLRTCLLQSAGIETWIRTGRYAFDNFDYGMVEYIETISQKTALDIIDSQIYRMKSLKTEDNIGEYLRKIMYDDIINSIREDFIL